MLMFSAQTAMKNSLPFWPCRHDWHILVWYHPTACCGPTTFALESHLPLETAHDIYRFVYEGGILQPFWWDLEGGFPPTALSLGPQTNLAYLDWVSGIYVYNNHAQMQLFERIKDALEPNGILSPGKSSGIWLKAPSA